MCNICDKSFATATQLRRHLTKVHLNSTVSCKFCKKTLKCYQNLLRHEEMHGDAHKHKCDKCPLEFKLYSQLYNHRRIHRNTPRGLFECDECTSKFESTVSLNQHKKRHGANAKKLILKCDICESDEIFATKLKLKRHMRSQHKSKYTCNKCGKMFNYKKSYERHLQIHEPDYIPKTYMCEICSKICGSYRKLSSHKRTHRDKNGERITCNVCFKDFSTKAIMKFHMKIHTGYRPYTCEVCGYAFKAKYDLTKHMRKHTQERPHKCTLCVKAFAERDTLKVHMRHHTGEKPYQCDKCKKCYITRSKLKIHVCKPK